MSDQPNSDSPTPTPPTPAASPETSAKEVTDKALGLAKEGVATLKALDLFTQIYLGGLAVAFLFGLVFDFMTIKFQMAGVMGDLGGMFPKSVGSVSAFDAGGNGKLAVLAALAGIGIWIWNFRATRKESWVPAALAGCAGLSALMYLILMVRSGSSQSSVAGSVNISMTLLGFWLPFAGAIAATVVAVKKLKQSTQP
jgi:hypothetical protein